jgi:N-acetylglucosamine malate deacetylase 1
MQRVLVVIAHADDEVLGCGGTLVKYAIRKFDIHLVYLTSTITSREEESDMARARAEVAEYLKATYVVENLSDQMLDRLPQLALNKIVEREIEAFKPNLVYTHTDADANVDHIAVSHSVLVAAVGIPVRMFEVPNPRRVRRQFAPNVYENITDHIEDKMELLRFYQQEMRPYPHPRSFDGVRILAQYRGMQRMMKYAEAFEEVT